MEWNIEENFSMERKIFTYAMEMEWKKIASMEYGKIVFHSIPRPVEHLTCYLVFSLPNYFIFYSRSVVLVRL